MECTLYQKTPRSGLLAELDAKTPFQSQYLQSIELAAHHIKRGMGAAFHSLYLCGDVAQRIAETTSDLEFALISTHPLNVKEHSTLNTLKWRIKQSSPAIKQVFIKVVPQSEIIDLSQIFHWGFFFKHCTVCLAGENIAHRFGHFEVSWEVSKAMNQDLNLKYKDLRQKIVQASKLETQLDAAEQISKHLIKASFSLVAHLEQCWEENVPRCAHFVLNHYPEKELEISRLFLLIQRKAVKKRAVILLIDEFKAWIQSEHIKIDKKIG